MRDGPTCMHIEVALNGLSVLQKIKEHVKLGWKSIEGMEEEFEEGDGH